MRRICRMGAWACGEKVWKTLMSIEISRKQDAKVREDLNVRRAFLLSKAGWPRWAG